MPGSGGFGWLHPGRYDLGGAAAGPTIDVPFIAATTVVFTPLVQDEDIAVPFIAATTTLFTPSLFDGGVRRVSQLPVEVLGLPIANARLSQLPAEVVSLPTSAAARTSQLPVEVLVLVDSKARLSQLPIEVLHRVLYEDIYVAVID